MKEYKLNPQPPFQLFRKKDNEFVPCNTKNLGPIWACGECGFLHSGECASELAQNCCKAFWCEKCQKEFPSYRTICPECSFLSKEKQLRENSEIVKYDGGPLYDALNDRFFADLEQFLDWIACKDDDELLPEYVHPCESRGLGNIDADDIIESALSDHYEDAYDHIKDIEGLQASLDAWVKKQTIESWYPDHTKIILVEGLL